MALNVTQITIYTNVLNYLFTLFYNGRLALLGVGYTTRFALPATESLKLRSNQKEKRPEGTKKHAKEAPDTNKNAKMLRQ